MKSHVAIFGGETFCVYSKGYWCINGDRLQRFAVDQAFRARRHLLRVHRVLVQLNYIFRIFRNVDRFALARGHSILRSVCFIAAFLWIRIGHVYGKWTSRHRNRVKFDANLMNLRLTVGPKRSSYQLVTNE